MSSTIETLRRMSRDIARNLEYMGHDKAVLATADHINKFWDPRMKELIYADDHSLLVPIAREAIEKLQAGAEPVKIDYDMEKTPRGWKVWDVRVADISLTANYRTEFANIVRDSGVDGLIKALHTKNAGPDKPVAAAPAAAEPPASEMKKKR